MNSPSVNRSSMQPTKRLCVAKKKKTVSFSLHAKQRRFSNSDEMNTTSLWFSHDEISAMAKRAKKLATIHYIRTRPGQPTPTKRSGIVYNCHPAHYEIIGDSLRGMEHLTDSSKAHRRERLRSCVLSIVEELKVHHCATKRSNLLCKYAACADEAMAYAQRIAREDARIASSIFREDLKQDDDADVSSISSLISLDSTTDIASSPCNVVDFP